MVLAIKSLLDTNLKPSESEIRDALSGVLCRCTGYVKPVQAALRAAAYLRGEIVPPVNPDEKYKSDDVFGLSDLSTHKFPVDYSGRVSTQVLPKMMIDQKPIKKTTQIGKPVEKVDGNKLVQGKAAFVADFAPKDVLIAKVLFSTEAHANVTNIDVSDALICLE